MQRFVNAANPLASERIEFAVIRLGIDSPETRPASTCASMEHRRAPHPAE
jgi:hypothetical protein